MSKLSKKDSIPTSCRVAPYNGANPLPEVIFPFGCYTVSSSFMFCRLLSCWLLCIMPFFCRHSFFFIDILSFSQNHPSLTSLPPLPEDGEVEDRTVVDDDNQGPSRPIVKLRVLTDPQLLLKKMLSLKPLLRHIPFLLLLQRTRGKGAKSKIPAPLKPKKLTLQLERQLSIHTPMPSSVRQLLFLLLTFLLFDVFHLFCSLHCRHFYCSDDEEEEQPIDAAARTSTSRTLVVSEAPHDGEETSPPQQNVDHSTPPASPRASSPKRARVEPSKEPIMFPGSSSTASLDDVSVSVFSLSSFFMFRSFQYFERGAQHLRLEKQQRIWKNFTNDSSL